MTDFDAAHPRDRHSGRFETKPQSAPEGELMPVSFAPRADAKVPSVAWEVDREEVAADLKAFDDYVDMFVASVDEGHLSRGVAGKGGTNAVAEWIQWADYRSEDESAEEFSDGIRKALVTLYGHHVGAPVNVHALSREELGDYAMLAGLEAANKRASKEARETWRQSLQHATAAEHRGMLVAAAALSGTDEWWGMRAQPGRCIAG